MLLVIVRSILDVINSSIQWGLQSVKNTIWKILFALIVFLTLLWLAAFMYGAFYYTFMPIASVSKPAHFQFSICDSGGSLCSYPVANVSFSPNELLMRGQRYRVVLRLEVPESHVNEKIGMFMVTLKFYNRFHRVTAISSRATMLRYRSPLLQTLHTLFHSALYLSGMDEQKQIIDVELFTDFTDDPLNPTVGALLELRNKKIQFYSSHLKIHAYFSGLRYLMFHWPLLSAIVGIGCNLATLVALTLVSWYQYCIYKKPNEMLDAIDDQLTMEERRRMIRARLNQERLDADMALLSANNNRSSLDAPPSQPIGTNQPKTIDNEPASQIPPTNIQATPTHEAVHSDSLDSAGVPVDDTPSIVTINSQDSSDTSESQLRHRTMPTSTKN